MGHVTNTCKFCGGPDACYGRRDQNGEYQDACEDCAKKPYPESGQKNEK